jgi:nicotinamide-nucleotide amidase
MISKKAQLVMAACISRNVMLTTAESCTGGMISTAITQIAGSSQVFERGFVTYTNTAKSDMLGIPESLIEQHGAVSQQVAEAMAEGALSMSMATIGVSVTGIAGPSGGSATKPVGLVHIACAYEGHETRHHRNVFSGDRDSVRQQSVEAALDMVLAALAQEP